MKEDGPLCHSPKRSVELGHVPGISGAGRSARRVGATVARCFTLRVAVVADLAEPSVRQEIFAFTEERGETVDLLVNNAGVGSYGEFCNSDAENSESCKVNCSAMVHLTHLYLPGMVERRSGDILIVSSTAAYQAMPYMATYAASKAFDLLFARRWPRRWNAMVCESVPSAPARRSRSSRRSRVCQTRSWSAWNRRTTWRGLGCGRWRRENTPSYRGS